MSGSRRFYPFNAEQTVNIAGEFGPLIAMFVVNALAGIEAGTWALIGSTVAAIVAMRLVLGRLPVFPLIASSVTILFGALTIVTNDPMWVQIKVTIFNAMFAIFLFAGLAFRKNFFKYVFEKTFHYTDEGWNNFTWSFAWFFVFTAILNEMVRLSYVDTQMYEIFGLEISGINIWILFKVAFIMPLSGIYAWYLTRFMRKYRVPDADPVPVRAAASAFPRRADRATTASDPRESGRTERREGRSA